MNHDRLHSVLQKITFNKAKRKELFFELEPAERPYILARLSKQTQFDLIQGMKEADLVDILEDIDPDKTTDILQLLPTNKQNRLIKKINKRLRDKILILNKFDPKTAAGLMNLDYILIDEDEKISAIIKRCKEHEQKTGKHPIIIVQDDHKLYGYLPGYALGYAKQEERVKKYVHKIIAIKHSATYNEVADIFRLHPHSKMAVLGEKGVVIGVIYSDDVLRAVQEEKAISLYKFAGVKKEEAVTDGLVTKIKFRNRWLIINIAMSFLIAFTVSLFEDLIAQFVLLAVYMPIVAGMAGNAGTQTLAVMVRGIALKQVDLGHAKAVIIQEVLAAIGNGIIIGTLVASIVFIINRSFELALILGLSMVAIFFFAAFFGALAPLILHRLGKDPATSAMVFITTAADVLGFFVFLGLASLILT